MSATQSRYYRIELLVAVTGVRLSLLHGRLGFSFLFCGFRSAAIFAQKKNTPNETHKLTSLSVGDLSKRLQLPGYRSLVVRRKFSACRMPQKYGNKLFARVCVYVW